MKKKEGKIIVDSTDNMDQRGLFRLYPASAWQWRGGKECVLYMSYEL